MVFIFNLSTSYTGIAYVDLQAIYKQIHNFKCVTLTISSNFVKYVRLFLWNPESPDVRFLFASSNGVHILRYSLYEFAKDLTLPLLDKIKQSRFLKKIESLRLHPMQIPLYPDL